MNSSTSCKPVQCLAIQLNCPPSPMQAHEWGRRSKSFILARYSIQNVVVFSAGDRLGSWNPVVYRNEADMWLRLSTMIGWNCYQWSCGSARWNLRLCLMAVDISLCTVPMVSQQLAQYLSWALLSTSRMKKYTVSRKSVPCKIQCEPCALSVGDIYQFILQHSPQHDFQSFMWYEKWIW